MHFNETYLIWSIYVLFLLKLELYVQIYIFAVWNVWIYQISSWCMYLGMHSFPATVTDISMSMHAALLLHCFSLPGTSAPLSRRVIMDTHSIRSLLPFHSVIYLFCCFLPLTLFTQFSLYFHVSCPAPVHHSAVGSLSPINWIKD